MGISKSIVSGNDRQRKTDDKDKEMAMTKDDLVCALMFGLLVVALCLI